MLIVFWVFNKVYKPETAQSSFEKIDDDHYIINGEYVSLEVDTEIDKMHQTFEDSKYFMEYASARRQAESEAAVEEWINTNRLYQEHKEEIVAMAENGEYEEEFLEYIMNLNAIQKEYPLDYRQFIAYKKYPFFAISFKQMPYMARLYTVHSDSTAKYQDDNSLSKEFEKRYY
jgi:hypothetical protein